MLKTVMTAESESSTPCWSIPKTCTLPSPANSRRSMRLRLIFTVRCSLAARAQVPCESRDGNIWVQASGNRTWRQPSATQTARLPAASVFPYRRGIVSSTVRGLELADDIGPQTESSTAEPLLPDDASEGAPEALVLCVKSVPSQRPVHSNLPQLEEFVIWNRWVRMPRPTPHQAPRAAGLCGNYD